MVSDCFTVPSSSLIRTSVEEAARRNADIVVPFDCIIDNINNYIEDSGLCRKDGKEIKILTIQEFYENDNQQNLVIVSPECVLKEILGNKNKREYIFIRD